MCVEQLVIHNSNELSKQWIELSFLLGKSYVFNNIMSKTINNDKGRTHVAILPMPHGFLPLLIGKVNVTT